MQHLQQSSFRTCFSSTLPTAGIHNSENWSIVQSCCAAAMQYIREEEWDAVMCNVPETAVALHLRQRLQVSWVRDLKGVVKWHPAVR